ANVLQSRRRIHGRNRYYTSINRKTLALREPSIHGSSPLARGTEFTSKAVLKSAKDNGAQWHYIDPGKPQQNAFIESF
ncbi:integrase core domain-containing protein, partial [Paracoccus bogoriensis]|uniref:integrase core domain-containing protein n=1 Tax=Paracoccus bogoriensis TaxID=242065 RepID=UPI001FE36213